MLHPPEEQIMRRALAVVCVLAFAGLCRADAGGMATPDAQANKPKPKAVPLHVNDDDRPERQEVSLSFS